MGRPLLEGSYRACIFGAKCATTAVALHEHTLGIPHCDTRRLDDVARHNTDTFTYRTIQTAGLLFYAHDVCSHLEYVGSPCGSPPGPNACAPTSVLQLARVGGLAAL